MRYISLKALLLLAAIALVAASALSMSLVAQGSQPQTPSGDLFVYGQR